MKVRFKEVHEVLRDFSDEQERVGLPLSRPLARMQVHSVSLISFLFYHASPPGVSSDEVPASDGIVAPSALRCSHSKTAHVAGHVLRQRMCRYVTRVERFPDSDRKRSQARSG